MGFEEVLLPPAVSVEVCPDCYCYLGGCCERSAGLKGGGGGGGGYVWGYRDEDPALELGCV